MMFECDCPPDNCAEKVQRYLDGDRQAGDQLAQKFTRLVQSIVSRLLGPDRREEWEDACQIVFMRLFGNLDQWDQRCPFCKWLAVVAARKAIDVSRMTSRQSQTCSLVEADLTDPRTEGIDHETLLRIEEEVARFPEEWQKVWQLWLEGRTREEMAEMMDRSLRTIQYWLAGIFDQLRTCLKDD